MNKQWLIIGAIVLILIGSYLWNRNRQPQNQGETIPEAQEVIVQEDGQMVKKNGELVEVLSDEEAAALKQEIEDKTAEAEPKTLIAVENQIGSGTSASIYKDGTYYQKVTVAGLEPLQKGYFYEVWLQKDDGSQVSLGRVEMSGSEGQFLYSTKEDKSTYSTVVISREIEDGNAAMGEKILTSQMN